MPAGLLNKSFDAFASITKWQELLHYPPVGVLYSVWERQVLHTKNTTQNATSQWNSSLSKPVAQPKVPFIAGSIIYTTPNIFPNAHKWDCQCAGVLRKREGLFWRLTLSCDEMPFLQQLRFFCPLPNTLEPRHIQGAVYLRFKTATSNSY